MLVVYNNVNGLSNCDVDDCDYKCKHKSDLTRHKASIHNEGVVWFHCNVDNCDYKCKQTSHLKAHNNFYY